MAGCVDVVSWADEEGHYASFPGSRSFIGDFSDADIDAARNRYEGTPMREALAAAGLAGRARAAFEPGRYQGYIEAHIEQGDELEAKALRVGIVTSIVGIWQYRLAFTGQQNHAGTTRMAVRRDAGVALIKLAAAIEGDVTMALVKNGDHRLSTPSDLKLLERTLDGLLEDVLA